MSKPKKSKLKRDNIFILIFSIILVALLITLGIIGVVASITIPAVVTKVNNMHYKSAYKK